MSVSKEITSEGLNYYKENVVRHRNGTLDQESKALIYVGDCIRYLSQNITNNDNIKTEIQQQKAENEELEKANKGFIPIVQELKREQEENTQLKQQLEENRETQFKNKCHHYVLGECSKNGKNCNKLERDCLKEAEQQLEVAEKALKYYASGMHICGGGSLIEDGTTAKQALSQMQKVGE